MAISILESEIFEQPDVIGRLIENETDNVKRMTANIKGKFTYVLIAARGTSDNAARYAQYLFGAHNRLQVGLATPSLFTLYDSVPDLSGALIIGVSQSGQSPDIISVLAEGQRQGCPTISITNDVSSPLANASDYVIPLHASPERSVAATKSYTASLAAMALFSCCLNENQDFLDDLRRIPAYMHHTFENVSSSLEHVERYRYMEHCAVIGRGYNYSTAFEVSLKVKELTRTVAEPYSSADFRHGPIATIYQGFPVILIIPRGAVFKDVKELLDRLRTLRAEMIIISDDREVLETAHLPLPVAAGMPEWLTPLAAVLPGQLFALHLTLQKGLNPDDPEGLTKVTETF
jgi:glutamine---fructose-6-phosphate transaminase (isomerizing)